MTSDPDTTAAVTRLRDIAIQKAFPRPLHPGQSSSDPIIRDYPEDHCAAMAEIAFPNMGKGDAKGSTVTFRQDSKSEEAIHILQGLFKGNPGVARHPGDWYRNSMRLLIETVYRQRIIEALRADKPTEIKRLDELIRAYEIAQNAHEWKDREDRAHKAFSETADAVASAVKYSAWERAAGYIDALIEYAEAERDADPWLNNMVSDMCNGDTRFQTNVAKVAGMLSREFNLPERVEAT